MDIAALSNELAMDPLGRGYAAMTAEEVVASLGARNRPGPVPAKVVRKYWMMNDAIWGKVRLLSETAGASATARAVAIQALDSLEPEAFGDFDLTDPAIAAGIAAQLDVLIAAGCLTAAHKAAILALGDNLRTRAEELGLGRVRAGHVIAARGE